MILGFVITNYDMSNVQLINNRFQRMQEATPGFHLMEREGSNFQEEIP